jgi:hypothetical protein
VRAGTQHHITTTPPIAAVRTAELDERLTTERRRPIAALSGADDHIHLIDERA